KPISVSEGAQAELGSDYLVNGEFTHPVLPTVRVFSAKRYAERQDDVDIFAHNPDRCWPLVGWKLRVIEPEFLTVDIAGIPVQFERRCYESGSRRELVYFGAVVAGRPLGYRLDCYLSFGQQVEKSERSGTFVRAADSRFWRFIWESFKSRRSLKGPKQ